jgi:hypothetical protein
MGNIFHTIKVGNVETISWDESVEAILDYKVRTHNLSEDLPEQSEVRRLNAEFHGGLPAEEIQVEELRLVISSLPRKTPGPDKMEVAVLQKVWGLCLNLFREFWLSVLRQAASQRYGNVESSVFSRSLRRHPRLTRSLTDRSAYCPFSTKSCRRL